MDLRKTKYRCIITEDEQQRLLGKYGFIFNWDTSKKLLAACIVSPKISGLVEKFRDLIPYTIPILQGDCEAILAFPQEELLNAHKVLKLLRKSSQSYPIYDTLMKSSS